MDIINLKIRPDWPKSKEETWNELFEPLVDQPTLQHSVNSPRQYEMVHSNICFPFPAYYAAAVILFAVLLTGFLYTKTTTTIRGEHTVVQLPDRSTVTLNAESKLSYKPYTWFISRKVNLQGEACFDVRQGNRFSVQSGRNQTNVLGTTFNVYTRHDMYRVTCLTGKVEVYAGGETAVLTPMMQAVFDKREFTVSNNISPAAATGWIAGKFVFDNTPLSEVIAEVERQYNIDVAPDYDPNHLFSGNFSHTDTPEETLEIIGKAFGIKFSVVR